jgi:hypothetical protein
LKFSKKISSGLAITGDLWVPRDWKLFNAITFGEDGEGQGILFAPRGVPEDHSFGTWLQYFNPEIKACECSIARVGNLQLLAELGQ